LGEDPITLLLAGGLAWTPDHEVEVLEQKKERRVNEAQKETAAKVKGKTFTASKTTAALYLRFKTVTAAIESQNPTSISIIETLN